MKRSLLAVAVVLSAFVPFLRAAINGTAYSSNLPFVMVNGVRAESVSGWSGGGMGSTVTSAAAATNGIRKKHINNLAYDAVFIESELPLSSSLASLLNGLCTGTPLPVALMLGQTNFNRVPTGTTIEGLNAQLVEVIFPALDAAGKGALTVTFVFQPEVLRFVAPPASVPASSTTRAKGATGYSLDLVGVAGSRISHIDEFRISRVLSTDEIGSVRDYAKTPGPTEFSNLKITVSLPDTTWPAWRDDFLVLGNTADANEKTGTLSFLTGTQQPVYSLQLLNVGLVHFTPNPGDANRLASFEVELYVEQIKPTAAPVAPSTKGAVETPPATPEKTDPAVPAETTKKPAAEPATAPVPETAAESVPADPRVIVKPDAAPASRMETGKTPVVKNPEDKGPRDPAGLARPEGTVRKNYMFNKWKGSSQELVSYSTARPMEEIEAFYDKALTGDGWVEDNRAENNNALNHAHQLSIKYTKAKDGIGVTFTDVQPGEVTIDIRIDRTF